MISKKKVHILRWLELLKKYREFKPQKINKINNNTYYLFSLFFKYLIFKDICNLNYTVLIHKYHLNMYLNFIECRFYYIFFFILIRNKMSDLILFLFSNRDEVYDKNTTVLFNNSYIFFFNKYIILSLYLLKYLNYFFLRFNKFKYYKNYRWYKHKHLDTYHNFFIYNEFKLKVDHFSFFLYRKYIDFFRFSKYNEYLANHVMFSKYPKLRHLLHIYFRRSRKYDGIARLNTFLNYFNIYKLNNSKYINNNKYKLKLKKKRFNIYCDILFTRSIKLNNIIFLKYDNIILYKKCFNFNIYKFFNILNKNYYLNNLLFNFSKIFLGIYISYICYHVYHIFIFRQKRIRRLKCRHLVSLLWKFTQINYKFSWPIYKVFYKFYTNNMINQYSLINFGFLSYYFLENNKFIKNNIKKNILLYRITNILVIEYISILSEHLHWDLDVDAHKAKSFKHPDVMKMWNINILTYLKKKKTTLIVPLNQNTWKKNDNKRIIIKNNPYYSLKYLLKVNYFFFRLWKFLYKWSISTFIDILNLTKDSLGFLKLFSNYKYSFEFISWEILNSNNNRYLLNKYFLKFQYCVNTIKIENIIIFFLSKYTFNTLLYFKYYPKHFLIYSSFSFFFLIDFFFCILSKKRKINNIKTYLLKKKVIINHYYYFYYRFFNWNIQLFLSWQRFLLFYSKHRYTYYVEHIHFPY